MRPGFACVFLGMAVLASVLALSLPANRHTDSWLQPGWPIARATAPPESADPPEGQSDGSDPFAIPSRDLWTEGMDAELLNTMLDTIHVQHSREDAIDTIDSVIILRHGHVILEAYPNPAYTANSLHHLFSVTKSITSLLVGIAIDQGLIGGISEPAIDYVPAAIESTRTITLEHLLTMSAGLDWDEDTYPTTDSRNDFTGMELAWDPIGFVLGKPSVHPPGKIFWYNSGLSEVLSAILATASGMTTLEFAREYLFNPLGIEDVRWNRDHAGYHKGGTQLYLRPRDLARIGQLCIDSGTWNGKQIVSSDWIEASTQTWIHGREDYFAGRSYGYHWWTADDFGAAYALGSQGQFMALFPELDLVVVFTGTVVHGEISPEILTRDFILPAIQQPEANAAIQCRLAQQASDQAMRRST